MCIGMPILVELDNLEKNVKMCCDLGLNFIEINMNLPEYQVDRLEPRELITLQKENNLIVNILRGDTLMTLEVKLIKGFFKGTNLFREDIIKG